VQATREVQLAAQKVLRENVRLRELLRQTGYSDEAIDAWVKLDGCEEQVLPKLMPKQVGINRLRLQTSAHDL